MSLVERAAKRLEELRRAGIGGRGEAALPQDGGIAVLEPTPIPEAAVIHERTRIKEGTIVVPRATCPTSVETPTAVEDALPVAPLHQTVTLDLAGLQERGFLTPDSPRSQLADEMRVIKRPIMRNAIGPGNVRVRNGNLVMITSAIAGEGKTFTSINLAMSLATELATTVLLVDGDVAHPGLPRALGIPHSPGLLDLLTWPNLSVGDALVRTNIPGLSILPAGSIHRRATELLASEQMASLLHDLSGRYPDRIVLFDSPPLLAATEARVLASHMGQILMVVAADSTLQSEVNLALAAIDSCDVVHMMLNKAARTDVGAYYGYFADDAR
jgi:exopolysaccharide/PEP-CTERM locus tyrosine autokinase